MSVTAIDLFAGLGGWTTGAKQAGVNVLWAANHWPSAVEWHEVNHPEVTHACQDLQQANWHEVPGHDILIASPCCQGHSRARGKKNGNPQHDASRNTAWAPVEALEVHKPGIGVIENVKEFLEWKLYPAWESAVKALGYAVSANIVDCADLGVPQNRERLFLVLTKSKNPLKLLLPKEAHKGADSFIDFGSGNWNPVLREGRAPATIARYLSGKARFGERFLMPYYKSGSGLTGRDITRPIGTITTKDRWALVDGDRMRMLTTRENLRAMTFPDAIKLPKSHKLALHMAGNAVPPLAAEKVLRAVLAAV